MAEQQVQFKPKPAFFQKGLKRKTTSNLDSGFDSLANRKYIFNRLLSPNIKENPRHRKSVKKGRKRLFNKEVYLQRFRVERTFAGTR